MKFLKVIFLLFVFLPIFAGVKWESITTSRNKIGTSTIKSKGYAEEDLVRIDYVEVSNMEMLYEEGSYWIYNGKTNTLSIVDTKEKEYIEIPIDSLFRIMEGFRNIMNMEIKNPKVEVKNLGKENVKGYLCDHYKIKSSYELEMSIMVMRVRMKTEESREIWATNDETFGSIFKGFKRNSFKTGIKAIDDLVEKEIEATKDLGFALKSIIVRKTYDNNNKLQEEQYTETIINNITKDKIPPSFFTVPKDYKKGEFRIKEFEGVEE